MVKQSNVEMAMRGEQLLWMEYDVNIKAADPKSIDKKKQCYLHVDSYTP